MSSLIDSLKDLVTPDLSARLASSLGEPEHNIAAGLNGGMASILSGILGKSGDSAAMQTVFSTVTNSANDGRVLDNPAELVGKTPSGPLGSLADQFLSSAFGTRASAVTDALSRSTGLGGRSVSSLMQMAAPLVLGVLGKTVRAGGLNLGSFTKLFTDERDSIERATPPEVAAALTEPERAAPSYAEQEVRREPLRADQRILDEAPESAKGNRWLWPTLAALAVLALFWANRARHREAPVAVVTPTPAVSGGEVVAPMPGITVVTLPNGSTLSVMANSAESRIVAFLNDPTKRASDASWLVLDRIQFETNSAKLRPASNAELTSIKEILSAYPNASVKIGGFTDNRGSEAENMRLSRERAEATRTALVSMGVDPGRVIAEGYGSRFPIASNATEAGRAQNRRISAMVVKK